MNQNQPPAPNWQPVFRGRLFEIVRSDQDWEKAIRAPGTRLIIDDEQNQKILLTREYRHELGAYDYRLPGGKVFDSLEQLESHRAKNSEIINAATQKVIQEAAQEAGYDIVNPQLFSISNLGATVEWDLYIFAATNFARRENGQELETGEIIETDNWYGYTEIQSMILKGDMSEERVALALLRYIRGKDSEL